MERVKDLILLVYTPREDSNARGTRRGCKKSIIRFLTIFQASALHQLENHLADCAFPYSHFDFMFLDSPDCKDGMEQSGSWPLLRAGQTNGAISRRHENMHMNYQVYLCSSATGRNQVISNDLSIAVSSEPAATMGVFNVEESILGALRFPLCGELPAIRQRMATPATTTTALQMLPSLPRRINLEEF